MKPRVIPKLHTEVGYFLHGYDAVYLCPGPEIRGDTSFLFWTELGVMGIRRADFVAGLDEGLIMVYVSA